MLGFGAAESKSTTGKEVELAASSRRSKVTAKRTFIKPDVGLEPTTTRLRV